MGCSGRTKYEDIRAEQKWDFISLNDFKSTSCFTPLAYAYLYISLTISVAVYGVDTFTAVNLLAFDRWSGEISPAIPFKISKWIFSICIIASWANLGYEYIRAIRVMRRGAVAESYLDSLAVRLQCIRPGQTGRGWRRFLVFAELTKSKKGAEYVALFTYFSFQSWVRVIFCSGPRQVVNGFTLYSVFKAKLGSDTGTNVGSSIVTFFKNLETLAEADHQQAVVLSGMIFTLIIWIFAALSLFVAMLMYIFFLWHYIPNHDNGLTGYCERKINSRLTKIVSVKVNKAIEEEERKKKKAYERAAKKGEKVVEGRQATLPTLFDPNDDNKLPSTPQLGRTDTMATLPVYSSRPNTPGGSQQPTLPAMELSSLDQKRPYMSRNGTQNSAISDASYASNAPLMAGAQDMGYGRSGSPVPSLPPLDTSYFPPMQRTNTGFSTASSSWQQTTSPEPMPSAGPMGPPRNLTNTPYSQSPSQYGDGSQGRQTPGGPNGRTDSPMGRMQTPGPGLSMGPQNGRGTPGAGMGSQMGSQNGRNTPGMGPQNGRNTPGAGNDPYGRSTPAPSGDSYGRPLPQQNGRATPGGRPPFAPGSGSEMGRSSPAPGSAMGRGGPLPGGQYSDPMMGRNSPAPGLDLGLGRNSPAPGQETGRSSPSPSTRFPVNPNSAGPQRSYTPFTPNGNNAQPAPPERSQTAFSANGPSQSERTFTPFNPNMQMRSASAAPGGPGGPGGPPTDRGFGPPARNFTAPIASADSENYFAAAGQAIPMRSNTPQAPQSQGQGRQMSPPDTYGRDVEAQRGPSRGPPGGYAPNRGANDSPFQAYRPNNY